MVFSSFSFLCFFLPATLLLYFAAPDRAKNLILVFASLLFYFWASPIVLPLLVGSCAVDYLISKRFDSPRGKWWLTIGIVLNILLLGYFKYANFLVLQSNSLLGSLGVHPLPWTEVLLPAGISFFTFEKISYLVDVWRKVVKPARNFVALFLFVAFFPHLIAGPILRYHDIEHQIRSRLHTASDFFEGWTRLCIGLGKKVLIADEVGRSADILFKLPLAELPANYLWLAVICYGLQLYFDFSGYSDMAIGLAKMFGFTFPENFDNPYVSRSITEFWQRWHISLSAWMREYLYIPLGGNKGSSAETYRNLIVVFFVSGLWHGAQWTFIVWGVFHGTFLVVERLGFSKVLSKLPLVLSRAYFLVVVLTGWLLFRSADICSAYQTFVGMWDLGSLAWRLPSTPLALVMHSRAQAVFVIALLIALFPTIVPPLLQAKSRTSHFLPRATWSLIVLLFSLMSLAGNSFTPFLYFQF